jgi:biopolymer transport protein ExbB/TolQ
MIAAALLKKTLFIAIVVGPSLKKQLSSKKLIKSFLISGAGVALTNIIFILLPKFWSNLLIGKDQIELGISFQDVMWFIFFIGIFQLRQRKAFFKNQQQYWGHSFLPEDFETIIDDEELTGIIKKTKQFSDDSNKILPYMILQISLQFRTNNSISLTTDFLTKQLDLFLHSIELSFNKLKYIIWVIPSIGFMGTVYGIGLAVSQLGEGSLDDPKLLTNMASHLGVAFNTTLLALILAVVLQFFAQQYESDEEGQMNDFGKYILDNLINKLVEKK